MSLLWIQAAWYNTKPGAEDWDEYGHGEETKPERVERYIRRVQYGHGVHPDAARRALQVATRNPGHSDATTFGFASAPRFSGDHSAVPVIDGISGARWRRTPVQDVGLDVPVHASQWFVNGSNVAHNLFHPGKRPSRYGEDDEFGHPDVEPEPWGREDLQDTREDEKQTGPSNAPRMIRQTDGSLLTVDGHHRVATDILLGKPHTRARVIDIRDLGKRQQPPTPTERPRTGAHRTDIPHEPGTLASCWECR